LGLVPASTLPCRFYAEAMKQGTSESLLSLAGSSTEADSTSRLTQLMGNVDEKVRGGINNSFSAGMKEGRGRAGGRGLL